MHALDPNVGFCRTLLAGCRKAWPSLQQTRLEWSLHLGAMWHVARPLLLAAVTLPGKTVLCGYHLSLVAGGGGSALGVVTIRRAHLWPPCWTELPFRSRGMAELCPAGNTVLLERKACRMDYGVGMKLLVFSTSHAQTRGIVQGLDTHQAPAPSSADAASPSSPSHLLAVLAWDFYHVGPGELLCSYL